MKHLFLNPFWTYPIGIEKKKQILSKFRHINNILLIDDIENSEKNPFMVKLKGYYI